MVPVLILCGEAGSGKDSAANHLASARGAVCIGQADPLKHMAREWFGFTDEQLFGPSACRNAIDERFTVEDDIALQGAHNLAYRNMENYGPGWCRKLFGRERIAEAMARLDNWWSSFIKPAINGRRLSPRLVLQTLGTEWGRSIDERVWSRHALDIAFDCLGGGWRYNRVNEPVKDGSFGGYNLAVITDGRFRNEILGTKRIGGIAVEVVRSANLSAEAQAAGVNGHRSESELGSVPKHFYDFRIANNGTLEQLYNRVDYVADQLMKSPVLLSA